MPRKRAGERTKKPPRPKTPPKRSKTNIAGPPLLDSERLLLSVIASLKGVLLVLDRRQRVLLSNWPGRVSRAAKSHLKEQFCYRLLKKRSSTCPECPAAATFADGKARFLENGNSVCSSSKEITFTPVFGIAGQVDYVVGYLWDVSERNKAALKQRKLEEQLRQAQRIEALGRLTGGIAHDFNNLLSPIIGYTDLLRPKFDPATIEGRFLGQIKLAAERAKALNHKMLAFSRRQIFEMKTVNLNDVIHNFYRVLRSIIRENIDIRLRLQENLASIQADITQLEQILMNLALNAQDAMVASGRLIVETGLARLDEEYVLRHQSVKPGLYVKLEITDTGMGIEPGIISKIFEPFFTTKTKSQGTGLGLAVVYGIIKQHGGNIWAYSEPGLGTTFKLYFPAVEAEPIALRKTGPIPLAKPGSETILVAEDSDDVRQLTCQMLHLHRYHVLEASSAEEAIRLYREFPQTIHLLLTDVIMPGMNGKELSSHLTSIRPGLKVLFMSGYSADVIAVHGILEKDVHFIQKPFSVAELLEHVEQALHG